MSKKIIVSPQIINTLEQSNDPWWIKERYKCFIYINQVCKHVQNIPSSFDYKGLYKDELKSTSNNFTDGSLKYTYTGSILGIGSITTYFIQTTFSADMIAQSRHPADFFIFWSSKNEHESVPYRTVRQFH